MKHWLAFALVLLLLSSCANPTPAVVPPTLATESITVTHPAPAPQANTPTLPTATPFPPTLAPTSTPSVPTAQLTTASATPIASDDVLLQATALLYERLNRERAAHGAPPLQPDATLETIARVRSQDMLTRNYFSHQDPTTGADLLPPLLEQYNYTAGFWGENLVTIKGHKLSAENLAQYFGNSWLASQGHADNILNPNYRHTGLGLVASPDNLQVIATQIFAE